MTDKTNVAELLPRQTILERVGRKRFNWLKFHRVWGTLDDEAIEAIALQLQLFKSQPDREIYRQGTKPTGLYLLQWGKVEVYRQSLVGKIHILNRKTGDIFGYEPLIGTDETAVYTESARAIGQSKIWFLTQEDLKALIGVYPEIQKAIETFLARDLTYLTRRLASEQTKALELQNYIQPVPTSESFINKSKASQKLLRQIEQAASDLEPVILQAPPGSGKTFQAGAIHVRSQIKEYPFVEIDCAELPKDSNGEVIFLKEDNRPGIIELLEKGTLLIDNAHLLGDRVLDRLSDYIKTGHFITNSYSQKHSVKSRTRLIFASSKKISLPGIEAHQIKLFPLWQRKEDIPELAAYFLEKFCRERGRETLQLERASLRRLVSYEYPGNLAELEGILKRSVAMTPKESATIPERLLWSVESEQNAFRLDLLSQFPWLRQFFLSQWWTKRLAMVIMAVFIPVVIMGFVGPQTPADNMIINFLWAWWWPVSLLILPFFGRLWCSICPFMIAGDWIQKLSLWIFPRQLLPWPNRWLNKWSAWALWAGFVAIYLWEEFWDLPRVPYLSSWLLLTIAAGAVICSLIYERRLWCRYLCPIGGMNGMFAKLSILELRSTRQVCGSQCRTFGCHKGSQATAVNFAEALPTEGQATAGCPLSSHPAQLLDNRDCVLCMSCLKACPNRSVQLNLRLPAADLLENHQTSRAEVALLLLLFGGVFLHYSPQILAWLGWQNVSFDSEHLLSTLPLAILLLSIPFIATYLTHRLALNFDPQMPDYSKMIYAYLPLTLAANLAYYVPSFFTEAGKILPISARTFGFKNLNLPVFVGSMDVADFVCGIVLIVGWGFSLYLLFGIARRSFSKNLPHLLLMSGFVSIFLCL